MSTRDSSFGISALTLNAPQFGSEAVFVRNELIEFNSGHIRPEADLDGVEYIDY